MVLLRRGVPPTHSRAPSPPPSTRPFPAPLPGVSSARPFRQALPRPFPAPLPRRLFRASLPFCCSKKLCKIENRPGTRKHKKKWNACQVQRITKAMRNAWSDPQMGAFKPALEIPCVDLDAQGSHQAARRPPRPLRPTFQRDSRCVSQCLRALLLFLFCIIFIFKAFRKFV